MLAGIRKYTRGFVALLFIGLLAVAFVIYEIRDIFTPQAGNDLASGEGVSISPREFNLEFEAEVRAQNEQNPGRQITQRDLVDAGIDRQILQSMVQRHARTALAERMGFGASDAMVRNRITTGFQNPITGVFDRAEYEQRLASMQITPQFYETFVRDELTRLQLERAVSVGVRAPSSFGRLIFTAVSERRTVSGARITAQRVPAPADPTDAELTAWYANPPPVFTRPEQRVLTLIIADPAQFSARVEINPEDLNKQIEFATARAGTPETRSFVQLSFGRDRAKADQAIARLRAGGQPETIAQELGGQLIPFANVQRTAVTDPAVAAALFDARAPGDFGVIESALGFSVARLTAITPGKAPDAAEIERTARADITQRLVEEQIQRAVDAFETAKANGEDIAKAAAENGLTLVRTPLIDAAGREDSGQPFAAAQGLGEKLAEAFKTPEGESTSFAPSEDRRWVSATVESIRASALRPLAEVRPQAIAAYKSQKLGEAMNALADAIRKDITAGKSFADALRERNVPMEITNQTFTREQIAQSPIAQLGGSLFGLRAGEVFATPAGNAVLLFHIDRIERSDPTTAPEQVEARRQQAGQLLQQTMEDTLTSFALREANVRTNTARLDQIVGRAQPTERQP